MPLMFQNGGGGRPYLRFSIEENSWLRSTEGGVEEIDFKDQPVLIDIDGIQQGWLSLTGGRDWIPWDDSGPSPRPGDSYKQGFVLLFYSTVLFGEDPIRELSSSAVGLIEFVKNLYNEVEGAKKFGTGQVPAVRIRPATKVRIGKGPTKIPQFEIAGYQERPAELLDAREEAVPAPAPPSPAATAPLPAGIQADDTFSI